MTKSMIYLIQLIFLLATACAEDSTSPTIRENDNTTVEEVKLEEQFMMEALLEVNKLRRQGIRCGNQNMRAVPKLKWNDQLAAAARRHAADMSNKRFFAHRGSDGKKVGARVNATGYQWRVVGENIANGYQDIKSVVAAWKDSPGHCKNMMSKDYTEMGLARVDHLWVQVLAKSK